MKALLLAAGLGTRLKPFTFLQAKASLPFLDVPLIHYPLQYLSTNKIDETIVNLHAHPDSVRKVAGSQYDQMKIEYSLEPQILGTAGAMTKAFPMLENKPFVVMNSDMISDIPLAFVKEHHERSRNLVTLVVMATEQAPGYNSLYFDPESLKLTGVSEGKGERCHYTGLQIVNPEVVERIPTDNKTEIFRDVYPALIQENGIGVILYDGLWMEMGTLQQYWKSAMRIVNSSLPEHLRPSGMSTDLFSPKATIETGATVVESSIMESAIVKDGAHLERCIVGPGVEVTKSYSNAALARGMLPWYF